MFIAIIIFWFFKSYIACNPNPKSVWLPFLIIPVANSTQAKHRVCGKVLTSIAEAVVGVLLGLYHNNETSTIIEKHFILCKAEQYWWGCWVNEFASTRTTQTLLIYTACKNAQQSGIHHKEDRKRVIEGGSNAPTFRNFFFGMKNITCQNTYALHKQNWPEDYVHHQNIQWSKCHLWFLSSRRVIWTSELLMIKMANNESWIITDCIV